MPTETKKSCCRSIPRCRDCPVLIVRERRAAQAPLAAIFEEIYGARPAPLPESVTQALAALSSLSASRRKPIRSR